MDNFEKKGLTLEMDCALKHKKDQVDDFKGTPEKIEFDNRVFLIAYEHVVQDKTLYFYVQLE